MVTTTMSAQWSAEAKTLIDYLYTFWAAQRRPPNPAEIHDATGMELRELRRTFRELQDGFALVFTSSALNLNLQKVTPFSATPTPVYFELDGRFHSFVGCPAEALTVSAMPAFAEATLTVKSSCACCYEPIEFELRNMDVLGSATMPIVSCVGSPYEWEHGVPADQVCDSIHFVMDEAHARRYEEYIARRGITLTLDQLKTIATPMAKARGWDPNWGPMWLDGAALVAGYGSVGADVGAWQ